MPRRFQTSGGDGTLKPQRRLLWRVGGNRRLRRDRGLGGDRGINRRAFGRRSELLSLGPGQQKDARLEGHLVRSYRLPEPQPFIFAAFLVAGGESEVSGPNELDDAPSEDRVRVDQSRQCAVQEALAQAGERPGSGVLERGRPMPVNVRELYRILAKRS